MAYALLFGLLLPFVVKMNEVLARHVGTIPGAWGPHIIGALFGAIFLLPFAGRQWIGSLTAAPWWAFFGGIVGTGMVILANRAVGALGAAAFITVNVATQLMTGALIDHFGLLESEVHALSPMRVGGMLLLALGAAMVVRG